MKKEDEVSLNEKEDRLLQAVLALFKAELVVQVIQQYRTYYGDIYKFKRHEFAAIRDRV